MAGMVDPRYTEAMRKGQTDITTHFGPSGGSYQTYAYPTPKPAAQPIAYKPAARAQAPRSGGAPTPGPGSGPALPPPAPDQIGPAPVVEPKPQANPASMNGLDAAMGGMGAGEGTNYIGTPLAGLRMLGRRTPAQDSMALAGVAGSIY